MATYYFSTTDGNDSRTSVQAQNSATPWQTITKLNAIFGTLNAGDNVLFKRGDTFTGQVIVNKSGSAGNPITLGAYGTGAKPILANMTTLTTWTSLGGGIYQATLAVEPKTVSIAGTQYAPGRFPNTGWLNVDSSAANQLTSTGLAGQPSLTGGRVVIRLNRFVMEKLTITSHTGNTIGYTTDYSDPDTGWGFFITNHASTLDTYGDWHWDSGTGKLKVYFGGAGTSDVQASIGDQVLTADTQTYITCSNLDFRHSLYSLIELQDTDHFTFDSCNFQFGGRFAIICGASFNKHLTITNNTFSKINSDGIKMYGGDNTGLVIQFNTFTDMGMIAGEGGVNEYRAISLEGNASLAADISYNTITNVGYVGINGGATNSIVKNNIITNFCTMLDDGGAIYIQELVGTGKRITGNIIRHGGYGAEAGTPDPASNNQAMGIYSDAGNISTEIDNNHITDCNRGIYMDDSADINIHDNTIYDVGEGISIEYLGHSTISNLSIQNNIVVNKDTTSNVLAIQRIVNSGPAISAWGGTIDNNWYERPMNDTDVIYTYDGATVGHHYTLAQWIANSPYDDHSHVAPMTVSNVANFRYEVNATNAPVTVSLGATYMSATGVTLGGSVTIPAYSSVVMFFVSGTTTTSTTTTSSSTTTTTTSAPTTTTTSTTTTTTHAPTTTTTTTTTSSTTTTTTIPPTTTTTTTSTTTTTTRPPTTTTTSTTTTTTRATTTTTSSTTTTTTRATTTTTSSTTTTTTARRRHRHFRFFFSKLRKKNNK